MMQYNHMIISEISFLNYTKPFSFFNGTLTENVQQDMEVQKCKDFFDRSHNASKVFINSYGNLRYKELLGKMGLFYYFNFPPKIVNKMKEISSAIVRDNDIATKKVTDDIYGLFFKKVYDNLIPLSTAIWMLKDSCVQENRTYLLANTGYQNNSSIKMSYSLANGKHDNIDLTDDELKKVEKYYNLLWPIILRRLNVAPQKSYSSDLDYIVENDIIDRSKESSFIRALIALQNARLSSQLPVKIDFYIQLFQCLYGVSGRSHKIAKEVSRYTAGLVKLSQEMSSNEKNRVIEVMEKAFTIRSKQSHGNKINYDSEVITKTAIKIDEYARIVLKKVLPQNKLDYNTKREAKRVNKYFNELAN